MSPRVSVITPYLDAAPYLAEAIASVRAQTCPDWELVLVDDGSSDGSTEIASEAARQDGRIRLLRRPPGSRGGAAAARNLALRSVRGEYIAFLDADDVFTPDKLHTQLDLMARYPDAMMVYGPTLWWHPVDERRNWTERMGALAGQLHPPPALLTRVVLMVRAPVPCICAVLVRRRAIELVDGFDERFRLYEDQTLWVKIMLRFPVLVSGHVTARYRQHPGSVSAASERDGRYDRLAPHPARRPFLDWVEQHVSASAIDEPTVAQALRRAAAMHSGDQSRLNRSDRALLFAYRWSDLARSAIGRLRWTARSVRQGRR